MVRAAAAADALVAALKDSFWQVRVKAARSIGQLKAETAIHALAPSLEHKISNLRKEAAAALGEIAHPDGLPYLVDVEDDPDPDVRKNIRWAIDQIQAA